MRLLQVSPSPHLIDALENAFAANSKFPAVVDSSGIITFGELRCMAKNIALQLKDEPSKIIEVAAEANGVEIAKLLGAIFSGKAYSSRVENSLAIKNSLEDIAAIHYTSGTTGKAKGILLSHQCVLFHALTYMHHMQLVPKDRISLFPSLHVGASVSNLFAAFLAGAAVYPISFKKLGLNGVVSYVTQNKLTALHMVPSLFRVLAKHPEISDALRHVHHLKLGGEAVTLRDAELFFKVSKHGTRLMNGLGITEAGGNVTFGEILPEDSFISVGKVVDGIKAEVVPGESPDSGELVLHSPFLASGYAEEDKNFTFNNDGSISLKTGDLVKRSNNGLWEHLGRLDEMVKINGERISLSAIDAELNSIPGVESALAVIDNKSEDDVVLCGVLVGQSLPKVSELRQYMKNQSIRFYRLDSMPVDGKLNRGSVLAMIKNISPLQDAPMRVPSSALEAHLLAMWKKTFRRDDIGVSDSFFFLGGDSLEAAEIVVDIHEQLEVSITIEQFYRNDSVEKLASVINDWREVDHPAVVLRRGERNIFIVPGAGSDVVALWHLAQALPSDINVIGLQYPGLDGKSPYLRTVNEIAAYFLCHIKKIQESGPYTIAGTSFGGMVAFEMARQLEADGESIAFLGLIDTYAPRYLKFKQGVGIVSALKYWMLPIARKQKWTVSIAFDGLKEKFRLLKARIGLPMSYGERFYFLMEACFSAGSSYVIHPLRSPVTIFRVEHQLPAELFSQDEWLGWKNASNSEVHSIQIPGVHGAHIRPPYVYSLAKILANEIN